MAVDESLRTVLLGVVAITDIVGPTGVFLDDAGQSDLLSYIVISQQSQRQFYDLSQPFSLKETMLVVECISKTRTRSRVLAIAVTSALENYSGTSGATQFVDVEWTDEGSSKIESNDGTSINFYTFIEGFKVKWRE